MILYHINLWYLILDKFSELIMPSLQSVPRDEAALRGLKQFNKFFIQITILKSKYFILVLQQTKLGTYLIYNINQLQNFIQWKSMKSGTVREKPK